MTIARVRAPKIIALAASLVALSLLQPAAGRAVPILSPVSITVYATYGMGPIHTTPITAAFRMDAILSIDYDDIPRSVDVYVGAILPDGRFASWVGDPQKPSVSTGAKPVPFLVSLTPVDATYNLNEQLSSTDQRGWYTLYGIIVPAGADPLDPHRWLSTSFYPLLVTPALF